MNFKRVILVFLLIPWLSRSFAQKEIDPVVDNIVEAIATATDREDLDLNELTQQLYFYYRHPLNLNTATASELELLYVLSDLQITDLKKHIARFGPLIDFAELQTIELFDKTTMVKLKPFVTVENTSFLGKLKLSKPENEFVLRVSQYLEPSKGFTSKIYNGSPARIFGRYSMYFSDKINFTLSVEKDPGEPFFGKNQKLGFDFYSASLSFRNIGRLKQLVIGDYSLQFGQGLAMWTGYSIGKSALVNAIAKNGNGPRPYRSIAENGYFRGLSASVSLSKHLSITPFFSYRYLDGNLIQKDSTDEVKVSSLQTTGYHRSSNELDDKQSLNELLVGGNLWISPLKRLNFSLTSYHLQFDKSLEQETALYNQFGFKGKEQTVYALAYQLNLVRFYFFGEQTKVSNGGMAFLNGVMMSLTPKATLTLVHRRFDKNFNSFYSQALSEASTNNNEKGFYAGLTVNFSTKLSLSAFSDFFEFPWLRYRVDAPSKGNEYFCMLTYSPSKKLSIEGRYSRQQKEIDLSNDASTITPVIDVVKNAYRVGLIYSLNEFIAIGNRADAVYFNNGINTTEKGLAFSLSIAAQNRSKKLSVDSRFTLFDTDSYNSRIYASERDILYSYSYAMYQDSGARFYINVKVSPLKKLSFWARYSIYSYRNKDELGSGNDLIQGNKKSEAKVQMRLTF
ncbi:hypothetical protein C3K47_12475 [Solitalea longa]|uniref:Helix-hairpin-helix domain-containing protein n=1 Tax=Solitalea longa TaxID=2079460 RepID=A0A2S5A176_9SPHI|nr:hypothetical protein [Solitalea longa]POY36012.1 hypothetical protein C3K47_12475 [Solitalea longa]